MAIARWDPFDAFVGAQEDLNRLFRSGWLRSPADELAQAGAWAPAVDIYETEDSLVVEAELPGVDPKNIDVSVDEGVLSLKGERKLEKEVKEENYHRVERAYGMFQRSVRLPSDVDADAIKANYESGVLKVSVPKVEPKKPKSVPIEVETKKEKK
ncbi:MAG: Hsp20/alpha crystallin family protein [Actinobacteria bacterium]|nr:Hsp20/alpha crystallin family protein [Actinomycetota bacterium]